LVFAIICQRVTISLGKPQQEQQQIKFKYSNQLIRSWCFVFSSICYQQGTFSNE
jgi:hypothetical protein